MREWVRSRVAYYASTRSYHGVLRLHGWEELGMELHRLSMDYRWDEMTALVTDEVLDHFVVAATWDELPPLLEARYRGLASDISFPAKIEDPADAERAAEVIARIKQIPTFADLHEA